MATKFSANDESQGDWSNYDFRTWDPGKLPASPTATITGTALSALIASPDWPTNLASGVSTLKKALSSALSTYAQTLQERASQLDQEPAGVAEAAQQQITAQQESLRSAATPPQPSADASSYQVAAKVVDRDNKAGLPGVPVTVVDKRHPGTSLASATTDLAGNAIVKLTERQITETGANLILQVASSQGKEFVSAPLCPKINHTETVVMPVAAKAELAQQLDLANLVLGQQQDLISRISTHVDAMKTINAQAKGEVQQELEQVQGMISDLG